MTTAISPVGKSKRISSMDIIRGIAVCGILLMNITGFGLFRSYDDPTVNGGATGWNLKVWWINSLFFEGTMRGMFSMLFGAGILLFTGRSQTESGVVTDLFFRRLLWMVLFGIIHCYILLWPGEILYCYGITGMFAFSFRHLAPKKLVAGTVILLLLITILNTKDYYRDKQVYENAAEATSKKDRGQAVSKNETADIEKWQKKLSDRKPSKETIQEEIAAMHKDYFSIAGHMAAEGQFMQTTFLYRYNFFDTLAMMLLGMAFLKWGVLKAALSNRKYVLMALLGYGIGLTVNYYETQLLLSDHFSVLSLSKSYLTYDAGRLPTTCGHIAVIMLFIKSGWLSFLQKALAAVGQMAFTNYIMQTLICNFIFLGYGLALYGTLQRHQLYYIVIAVWILQLILSPVWLSYFRFGPLEWLWRSLTYWQRQPFKKKENEELN